jgi:hypothetical protein
MICRSAIYLCHTETNMSYAVCVVISYMHDPRTGHLEAAHQIFTLSKREPSNRFMVQCQWALECIGLL